MALLGKRLSQAVYEASCYISSSMYLFVRVSSSVSFYCCYGHPCGMSSTSLNDLGPTFEATTGFLPKRVQFRPLPVHPALQLQLYDPLVFLHLA